MKNVLIKLGKSHKTFLWDDYITGPCKSVEIIAPGLEEIEDRFDELPNLKAVSIHCPNLLALPSTLFDPKGLEILKIKNCENIKIPENIVLHKLKILQLAKIGLKKLPSWICHCLALDTLDLHGNHLTDLPDNFIKLQNLKRLNLDANDFTTLPWEIEELSQLNHLSIDNNFFSEEEMQRIENVLNIKF